MSPIAIDPLAIFDADQPVLHHGHRATLLRTGRGRALVHYWEDSRAVSVDSDTLAAGDEPLTRERQSRSGESG